MTPPLNTAIHPDFVRIRQFRKGDTIETLSVKEAPRSMVKDAFEHSESASHNVYQIQQDIIEGPPAAHDHSGHECQHKAEGTIYEELLVRKDALSPEQSRLWEQSQEMSLEDITKRWPGAEVNTLVNQGPSENRIDLTIVGDGYTDEEKKKFFKDAKRLTEDLFAGETFGSYLPLFNVHAVFVPSQDSGITDGAQRKDTALSLYRSPAGSKRGIMPGDRRAAEQAIDLAPDTDYPILVANDDFYGGLGGRYAITTRSHNSGSMVLRHELGHNFGRVGEEYDGGQVYSGANHSRSKNLSWDHWLDARSKLNERKILAVGYPWQNITDKPLEVDFKVPEPEDGVPYRVGVSISSVGWASDQDVELRIDGKPVEYEGVYTEDRSFFKLKNVQDLPAGPHRLTVLDKNGDGDNMVANIQIDALPEDYDLNPDQVGGYATFNHRGQHVGYRPTHESCLMRNMRETQFCSVDQENMWHEFLNRVDLIDGVKVSNADGQRRVEVATPDLDGLSFHWFEQQTNTEGRVEWVERIDLEGQKSWLPQAEDSGRFKVDVRFETDEVRRYSSRFRTEEEFSL